MSINEKCWYKNVCIKEENCEGESCVKYIEMKYLIEHSGIPKLKHLPPILTPFDDEEEEVFGKLTKLKNNIPTIVKNGQNIYIASSITGNGKTSWAIKILLRYFDQIWAGNGLRTRGLFVHVPTLLLQLKNFDAPLSKGYLDHLKECDLVVWDDIGGMQMSNYDYSQLLALIDYRSLAGKSNIFTSNIVSKKDLAEQVGAKIASRIYNSKTYVIIMTGRDRR